MNNRRAHEVLKEMQLDTFTKDDIGGDAPYVCSWLKDGFVTLDYRFTADQLEAIAAWMRDPKGVSEGVDVPNAHKSCGITEYYHCEEVKCED